VLPFHHNDAGHASDLLKQHRAGHRHTLLITEGVFSMDGDRAPLNELAPLARNFDTWLMVDDAHDVDFAKAGQAYVPIRIGTLSKAIGSYGGYVCASQPVIDLIRNRARTLIYSTGLPPAVVAAAIAALDVIEREPERLKLSLAKAQAFTRAAGLPLAQSAIVPVLIGQADAALAASQMLEAEGLLAVAIRPPTVPKGTARLRLSFSAAHPDAEIARLADIVRTRILRNT
jgi:8-amino-7-oxononanoate synthase